jgi:hypothetical protein
MNVFACFLFITCQVKGSIKWRAMTDGSTCVYPRFHDINNVLASDQGNSGAFEDKVRSQ